MEWRQPFYRASITNNTIQLSPRTTATTGCTRDISLPPQLAALQMSITTASATPPTDFFPAGGCAFYEVIVRKVN